MNLTRAALVIGLVIGLPVLGGWSSCEASVNDDPSFDLWCGSELCYWQTDAGSVRREPTWHPADYGVALVGDPATISQRIEVPDRWSPPRCYRFETLADIDPNTSVSLELDFQDDGLVDFRTPVAGNDWVDVQYLVTAPTWHQTVRFTLRKTGPGRAVLAQLRITQSAYCSGDPLPLDGRPTGAFCETDQQCLGGLCENESCGTCRTSDACQSGEVCRLLSSEYGYYSGCAPPLPTFLGAPCSDDAACLSGICCLGVCSQCCDDDPCADAVACAQANPDAAQPWQCAPGQRQGSPGSACMRNDDCQSAACLSPSYLGTCSVGAHEFCIADDECVAKGGPASGCEPWILSDGECS
jgi:hypothetical protein